MEREWGGLYEQKLYSVEVFSGAHHTSSARKNIHQDIIIYGLKC